MMNEIRDGWYIVDGVRVCPADTYFEATKLEREFLLTLWREAWDRLVEWDHAFKWGRWQRIIGNESLATKRDQHVLELHGC